MTQLSQEHFIYLCNKMQEVLNELSADAEETDEFDLQDLFQEDLKYNQEVFNRFVANRGIDQLEHELHDQDTACRERFYEVFEAIDWIREENFSSDNDSLKETSARPLSDFIGQTLGDFLESSSRGFMVGDIIDIRSETGTERRLVVGNCTPYIQPTTNDGGIGWDWHDLYGTWTIFGVISEVISNQTIPFATGEEDDFTC